MNKKKEAINYTGLSLKVAIISFIALILIMVLSTILNTIDTSICMLIYETARTIIILSLLYFFISTIYNQFRNKRILWAIINTFLLITGISLWFEDIDEALFPLAICLVSCLVFYFKHIKPNFKILKSGGKSKKIA